MTLILFQKNTSVGIKSDIIGLKRYYLAKKEAFMTSRMFFYIFVFLSICLILPIQTNASPYAASDEWIEIMFDWDTDVRMRGGEPVDLAHNNTPVLEPILNGLSEYSWHRISELDESYLDYLHSNAEKNLREPVYNLNNAYRLHVPGLDDVWALAARIQSDPSVLRADPVPLPMPLPTPPPYQSYQGYLQPASSTPTGIDAAYAWTQVGGTGLGVTVCDLEYDWNYSHNDITKAAGSQINTNCMTTGLPANSDHHGTAVLGELVSDNNGWGTTGICYDANLYTCCTITGTYPGSWNVANAITLAISYMSAGDVILLEQQWDYDSSGSFIPIENWLCYYPNPQTTNVVHTAIQTAVANGIHVVEAAGNGNYNLDDNTTINMDNFTDSGAIIVGAGGAYPGGTYPSYPAGDLQRLSFSSYGSVVNLQGWGEDVFTTGYGTYYSAEGVNYYYTSTFNGTSSASPIVAGAVACCVGYWTQGLGLSAASLTPSMLLNVLVNTGTAQVSGPNPGNIGPRPDLQAAFSALAAMAPTPTPTEPPVPDGEYGDAPDETFSGVGVWDAYPAVPGMQAAHFPTFYNSIYGMDPHGACYTIIGYPLFLSTTVTPPSYENDAYDPSDPDGIPNIDPFALACDMDSAPVGGDDGVIFYVTPPEGVDIWLQGFSNGYFSLLVDLNQDGDWNEPNELLIADHNATMINQAEFIPLPGGFQGTTGEVWCRAVISDVPLANYVSTWPNWDGSFAIAGGGGEVEDYLIVIPSSATPTPTPVTPTATPTGSQPTATPTGSPPQVPVTSTAGFLMIVAVFTALILFASRRQ